MSNENELEGKRLKYLIGTDYPGEYPQNIVEVGYDVRFPGVNGTTYIKYCNLFDEHNTGGYGPYLSGNDVAEQYGEGQIDPAGAGWAKNLRTQFVRACSEGFKYVELDNPDAYHVDDVLGAVDLAQTYGLKVIAKNAGLVDTGPTKYIGHDNVYGIIVEKGAYSPVYYDSLRKGVCKDTLPVWFVFFGNRAAAQLAAVAIADKRYVNMYVTYSARGEYGSSEDVT